MAAAAAEGKDFLVDTDDTDKMDDMTEKQKKRVMKEKRREREREREETGGGGGEGGGEVFIRIQSSSGCIAGRNPTPAPPGLDPAGARTSTARRSSRVRGPPPVKRLESLCSKAKFLAMSRTERLAVCSECGPGPKKRRQTERRADIPGANRAGGGGGAARSSSAGTGHGFSALPGATSPPLLGGAFCPPTGGRCPAGRPPRWEECDRATTAKRVLTESVPARGRKRW
jgi:hypothetical protein